MLAKEILLTTPLFGIAEVDSNTIIATSVGMLSKFEGVGFFAEYLPLTAKISSRIARHISNLDETCKMLLLDAIVKNGDRSSSNVLVDIRNDSRKMFAIDYSHAFGDPEWTPTTLQIGDYDSPYVWRENQDLYDMLHQANADISLPRLQTEASFIRTRINEDIVHKIISTIPSQWAEAIGSTNILYAGEYVLSRVDSIDKICLMINKERGIG